MISETFAIIRKNFLFYVVTVSLIIAAIILDDHFSHTSSQTTGFIWILLSRWTQVSMLYNRRFKDQGRQYYSLSKDLGFFGKNILIILLATVSAIATAVYFGSNQGNFTGLVLIYGILFSLIVSSVLYALIGTWLPAGLYGSATRFGDALRRGSRTFAKTFARIFIAMAIPAAISFIVTALMFARGDSGSIFVAGVINFPSLLIAICLSTLEAGSVTYVSVVLTREYMRAEGLPVMPTLEAAT